MPQEEALLKLHTLPAEEQLAVLDMLEAQRKEKHYAKYWASSTDPRFERFFNQIEEDFKKLTPAKKIYVMLGGNRSSKTERGAFLAVAWLMGKEYFQDEPSWRYVRDLPIPEKGVNIWCVGLDFTVIKHVIWNEKIRRGSGKPGLLPETPNPIITHLSDSEFTVSVNVNGRKSNLICKSAEAGREKFQSASCDLVWIDEEVDEDIFDEIYQRTVDVAGKIILTLTPLLDIASGVHRPWVHGLWKEWNAGRSDCEFVKLNTLDNPYIPDDEKVKLKEKWAGHPEEGARLFGDFIKRAGMVYDCFDKKVHVIKPFKLDPGLRRIVSIDPAATGITAVIWGAVMGNNDLYVYRVYYERDKPVSEHAKDILVRNGADKVDMWLIDPFWGSQRNAESHKQGFQLYREHGINVRLAPRAEDFGRDLLREYFEATRDKTARHPKIFIFDTCHPLINEIEGYTWDTFARGPMKGLSKDKPMKRNDHAVNALQYLVSTRPKAKRSSAGETASATNSYT
jgi:phage terminase large subunit-like protein